MARRIMSVLAESYTLVFSFKIIPTKAFEGYVDDGRDGPSYNILSRVNFLAPNSKNCKFR